MIFRSKDKSEYVIGRLRQLQKSSLLVTAAALVVVVATLVFLYRGSGAHISSEAQSVMKINPGDHLIGNPNAPVQAYVYTDLQCEYCKTFHEKTLPVLLKDYGSNVLVVYRHYMLPRHPYAYHEAAAAECAYEQGGDDAFWGFINRWFAVTDFTGAKDATLIPQTAKDIGLNPTAFAECLQSGRTGAHINRDIVEATSNGIDFMPSVLFVDKDKSVLVKGNYLAQMRAAIHYLLGR